MDLNSSILTQIYWSYSAIFGPEIKVQLRSSEVLKYSEINKKATGDIQSTSKLDQNHFKCKLWTLSRCFWSNIVILVIFRPEMKVHMSSKVPGYTEINKKKATRGIQYN